MFKKKWSDVYPSKFRLVCKDSEDGPHWIFEKRFLVFFWREIAKCQRYDTAQILLEYYKARFEERGRL